jgi:hypothetical protein
VGAHNLRNVNNGSRVYTASGLPRTVALYPSVLSENEAVQLLSKVLDHVIAFSLSVYEQVETNALLETHNMFNFFLDELFILLWSDFFFGQLRTSEANLFCLLKEFEQLNYLVLIS